MLLALTAYLALVLAALAAVDLRSFRLPDGLNLALAAGGVAAVLSGEGPTALEAVLGGALGGGLLGAMMWGYRRWRGREGLGLGDVKLAAAGGLWTGWAGIGVMLTVAALAALAAVLAGRLAAGRWPADQLLPFGPFLGLGIFVAWLMSLGWL